jgi:hydroxyacylglutathione hydrolase
VAATDATVHVHAAARREFDHDPFEDGWELALGAVRVRAVHTPGHRPEHTAFAVVDGARGPEPVALLTGDSLFVGGLARPDLAVERETGARELFRSLRDRLLRFAPGCEVWPGHVGGSLCGGPGLSLKVSSTLGYELEHQGLLGVRGEQEFVRCLLASLGPQPPNVRRIVARNSGPLGLWDGEPPPLSPREIEASGALVVDVRADAEFDAGHVPGALSVSAERPWFGTRLGWVVDPERPVVLVGGDVRRAAALAAAVGITEIAGHLRGGMAAWDRPVARIERIGVDELHALSGAALIVDVRDRAEWDAGHLDGSLRLPYRDIRGLPPELDPEHPGRGHLRDGEPRRARRQPPRPPRRPEGAARRRRRRGRLARAAQRDARKSLITGAIAAGSTAWLWPSRVWTRALGRRSAIARAPACMNGSLSEPAIARVGAVICAHSSGSGVPSILASTWRPS